MPTLDWTDVLDIGLPELDDQHKKLISFSNSLLQAMTVGKGEDILHDLFEELKDYTLYHFEAEEQYMITIEYPHLEAHKTAHQALVRHVDQFSAALRGPGVSPNLVLDFINNWIMVHIMEEDSQIGTYAKSL